MEPAGWIPPQFREFIYEAMTDEELEKIRMCMGTHYPDGRFVRPSVEDLRREGRDKKVVGVRDTRTGEVQKASSSVPFVIA